MIQRSTLAPSSQTSPPVNSAYAVPPEDRPEFGHSPSRIGLSLGLQRIPGMGVNPIFQELTYKFAYHDLMNNDVGYLANSEINFPWATLRFYPGWPQTQTGAFSATGPHLIWLERLQLFGITSLFPIQFIEKKLSWQLQADYYSPKDFGCWNCHAARILGGTGVSVNVTPKVTTYVFGLLDLEYGNALGFRVAPKGQWGLLMNPWKNYKFQFIAHLLWDLFPGSRQSYFTELSVEQSFSFNRALELRNSFTSLIPSKPSLAGGGSFSEAKLNLNWYF